MSIEEDIFKRYSADFKSLVQYGFEHEDNCYICEKYFHDKNFKAVITITENGNVSGKVFDLENNDEFLPLRLKNSEGSFAGEIRAEYEKILVEIREKCFEEKYFVYNQSNRITSLIIKKYGNEPEFLWKTFPGCGVFRNPETKKWYAGILDVDRSKLQKDRKGCIEVIDLRLDSERAKEVSSKPNFYPGYHMNKKYWISVILDDSVPDKKIMELIEESHKFSQKKK